MSPTLLELIVAIVLLLVACQIGALIAPRVIASFLSFWRSPKPPMPDNKWRREKNITPPPTSGSPPAHG